MVLNFVQGIRSLSSKPDLGCALSPWCRPVSRRWVYRVKFRHDGFIEHKKTRREVWGFTPEYDIGYNETCSIFSNNHHVHFACNCGSSKVALVPYGWQFKGVTMFTQYEPPLRYEELIKLKSFLWRRKKSRICAALLGNSKAIKKKSSVRPIRAHHIY